MYLRYPLSPAVVFTPSLRPCSTSLSTSSSNRTSFPTSATVLPRTNSLLLRSFVSPSILFLFQLPTHIADLSFSISLFSYYSVSASFRFSSVSHYLFNLLCFISPKAQRWSAYIWRFLLFLVPSAVVMHALVVLCSLPRHFIYIEVFFWTRDEPRDEPCDDLQCVIRNLHLNLRWTARWSYTFRIFPVRVHQSARLLDESASDNILLRDCIWI